MISGLQPKRPKPPHQSSPATYQHQQKRVLGQESLSQASSLPRLSPLEASSQPRNQIEAMPPNRPVQSPTLFDSAVRHPVFFTQNLRKPPFTIPQIASQGWSPVASGYIMEQQKAMNANPRTKL